MKRLLLLHHFVLVHLFSQLSFAHEHAMLDKDYPQPPPTVAPGPDAALIKVHLIDAFSQTTTSATVSVNNGAQEPDDDPYRRFSLRRSANRHKGPIRFRPLDYYFYSDGRFAVRVPPGPTRLEFMKGYEYQRTEINLMVAPKDTVELEVVLEKAIDMAEIGWYSGDTHIHMQRTGVNDDTLLTVISAKDIRYAYLLSMNTRGYDRGQQYESWRQLHGLGEQSDVSRGVYTISSGQEYRTRTLGHVTVIMPTAYVPGTGLTDNTDLGPSLSVIADQAHRLHGFIGLNHGGYPHQESDALLLENKMDFLELLQFGGYRSLGLHGWYDFLNIGFRLPIIGPCDFPYTRELGSEITYVWDTAIPTTRSFVEALAQGRSFATSGPMLFLEVSGKKPGAIISCSADSDTTLDIRIRAQSHLYPVRYLELIMNGRVIERQYSEKPRASWDFRRKLPISKSAWIAARTYAEGGTDAHTNPVYVYVGKQRPFDRESARHIMTRLLESIATIPNQEIVAGLKKLQTELERLILGKKSTIVLPAIRGR
jgi:hypothetical protein